MTEIARHCIVVAILALTPAAAPAQGPPAEKPVRAFAMPPLEELHATRDRPLFSPHRKPDAPVVATPQEPEVVLEAPESQPFDLTGVVIGEDRAVAILHNRETQETVHKRQGEKVDVWSVAEIAPRHVILRHEGKEVRLQLFEPRPDGTMAEAPPPPPRRDPNLRRRNVEQPMLRRDSRDDRQRRRRQQQ